MLPRPPGEIASLLTRPVAVFGAGVSGQGVLTLLAVLDALGVIYDEKAEGTAREFGPAQAASHRLVIFSPGFSPEHPWLVAARAAGCTCLGELDFASLFWRGQLVAITGTNGKTTLTEFLAHALRAAGETAQVVGNIGYSFCRFVAGEPAVRYAVCEVSSFQAETLRHLRPDAVLWTNFAEDHLERHPGMEAYFAAKWRLIEQGAAGHCLVAGSVAAVARRYGRTLPARCEVVVTDGQTPDPRLRDTIFAAYPQYENFLLAAAWWRHAGLAERDLFAAAGTFRLGAHRLARVGEQYGVTFWNDSKATNFHAVEAALAGFDRPVLWIGGGKAKGGDLGAFIARIARKVRAAFLIGETKQVLAAHCQHHGVPFTLCATLAEAVGAARALAVPGDHLVLSPGFASFDMFAGYDDRGRQFEALVAPR
jgi:UDP-N-acetylmuramoylalanine--D-glutamate ligase